MFNLFCYRIAVTGWHGTKIHPRTVLGIWTTCQYHWTSGRFSFILQTKIKNKLKELSKQKLDKYSFLQWTLTDSGNANLKTLRPSCTVFKITWNCCKAGCELPGVMGCATDLWGGRWFLISILCRFFYFRRRERMENVVLSLTATPSRSTLTTCTLLQRFGCDVGENPSSGVTVAIQPIHPLFGLIIICTWRM